MCTAWRFIGSPISSHEYSTSIAWLSTGFVRKGQCPLQLRERDSANSHGLSPTGVTAGDLDRGAGDMQSVREGLDDSLVGLPVDGRSGDGDLQAIAQEGEGRPRSPR